jgi:hypothetical protein
LTTALWGQTALSPQASTPSFYSPVSELNGVLPAWLRFDADFRTRFEGYSGGSFKPNTSDIYALTRLKIGMTIRPTSWLKFFGEGYDARAIAKSPAIPPYQNTWDIRQAYVELGGTESGTFGVKVGRQVINLGDQRLVGESPWTNAERTFDAAVGTVRSHGYRLELISASVVNEVDGTWDHHQQGNDLHGLYGGIEKLVPDAVIEPYVFWRVQPGVKDEEGVVSKVNEKVPGVRWAGKLPYGLDYGMEMVREFGSLGPDRIQAWAGHWMVGRVTKSLPWSPRLYGEFNHASGDANPKDGIRGTFDQLYPSGHDKYGLSDQIGWKNMNDFRAGLETKPRKNVGLNVEYNDWFLASRCDAMYNSSGTALFRVSNGSAGTRIGQEMDLIATWNVFQPLQVGAGFGHIFPGQFLHIATPGVAYSFPYLMLGYKF